MAKIYGLFGAMTGKVADAVMVVRNGEQIVRKYQPVVTNPQTAAQVAARAKLKLMSQLSAIMSPVIAIPKMGGVSSRNMFVKENYALSSYSSSTASINFADIQLTKSVVSLPAVSALRGESLITLSIVETPMVDRVVYAVFEKLPNNSLRLVTTKTSAVDPDNPNGATSVPNIPAPLVIYAYGIRLNSDKAKAVYGNVEAPTAEVFARLVVTRTLTEVDVTLTSTVSTALAAPNA